MYVRRLAAIALASAVVLASPGDLRAGESEAELLRKLGASDDAAERAQTIVSLERRTSEAVRRALETIAADGTEDGQVRMQAICSLAASATRDSVPVLMKIVETDLVERRGFWACAVPLLGTLKDRRALPLLLRIADLEEEHLAGMDHMAIEAVAVMADEREVNFLAAKAHILPVRLAVMSALALIGSPDTADILISGLETAEDDEITAAAESGLLKIGRPAIPALESALTQHPDDILRTRVRAILARIRKAR